MVRRWAFAAVLSLAGCESLRNPPPPVATEAACGFAPAPPEAVATPQAAEPAPAAAPEPAEPDDPLTRVAECLERGDRANAAVHLEAYVRLHPDQVMFRAQLAELFLRLGRDDAARVQFERFADDARKTTGPPRDHLVHVHTRLMEIGQRGGDHFAETYHRGVGLLLLVKDEDGKADRDADFCEEMLCKALKALAEARELNPGEPRVRIHLAEVYDRCGNRRAADVERAAARTAPVPAGLGVTLR